MQTLGNAPGFGQSLSAPMVLWTSWKAGLSEVFLRLFSEWSGADLLLQPEQFGLALMDNDWWKDVGWELEVLDLMHHALPVRSVHVAMVKMGYVPSFSLRPVHRGIQKIAQLVDAIEAAGSAVPAAPAPVLLECEEFARHRGQWLKVAGLEKAEIIEDSL